MEGHIKVIIRLKEIGPMEYWLNQCFMNRFWDSQVIEVVEKVGTCCKHVFIPWTSIIKLELPTEEI